MSAASQPEPPDPSPLGDVRVVDLSWVVAGPAIGRALADFGATVVRVESEQKVDLARLVGPHRDAPGLDTSACFANVNAGKLGLALDLKHEAAREIVLDLAAWGDVVIESFAPGVMARLGLGYDVLSARSPALIMVSTSLMGQSGPYARFAGSGNVGAALAGFQALSGWPDEPPLGPYGPYTDYVGPRFALVALLAALDHRRRTGEGACLDVSQVEATVELLAPQLIDHERTGRLPEVAGNRHPNMAPHGVYPTQPDACGEPAWIAIAVADDGAWRGLCTALGRGRLAADPRYATAEARLANVDALDSVIGRATAGRVGPALERDLQKAGVAAHVVASPRDVLVDSQLAHRGHFVALEHPVHGTSVVEGPRYRLTATPGVPRRAAPAIGADTDHVLSDLLAYPAERVAALRDAGALR